MLNQPWSKRDVSRAPSHHPAGGHIRHCGGQVVARPAQNPRRLIDTIRVVGATLHRPPRRHHPERSSYSSCHAWPAKWTDHEYLQTVVTVVLMALFAVGLHDLQL